MTLDTYRGNREVPLADLVHYPGNAKKGDVEAIRASLRRHGQYRAIIVRDEGDGRLVVVAGNHTMDALRAEGATSARCEIHEFDDDTARRINIADNKIAALGLFDDDLLLEQLSYLDGDYEGVGWTAGEVDHRLDGYGPLDDGHEISASALDDDLPASEEADTATSAGAAAASDPDGGSAPRQLQFGVFVSCLDEHDQAVTHEALREQGYDCRLPAGT